MHAHLAERQWNFEVWFMVHSEPGRNWNFSDTDFNFSHRFLRGVHLQIGSAPLHANPGVLHLLQSIQPDILLVAGGWINPTVYLASRSAAAKKKVFWSESHLGSTRRTGIASNLARGYALSRFNEFAVPGSLAEEYIRKHTTPTRIHRLPNLVDPAIFRDKIVMARSRAKDNASNKRVLLISARLAPEKGLLQFLNSLQQLDRASLEKLTIAIAGTGPLLRKLKRWVASHSLDVRLIGHKTEAEMVMLYAEADAFCLPSLSDPNPLSVIEAVWAGLPLLLSSRIGNHPECLEDTTNGFLFDPFDCHSTISAISRWLQLSREEISNLGKHSLYIAQREFDPDQVIRRFLDELMPEYRLEPAFPMKDSHNAVRPKDHVNSFAQSGPA